MVNPSADEERIHWKEENLAKIDVVGRKQTLAVFLTNLALYHIPRFAVCIRGYPCLSPLFWHFADDSK